MKLLLRLILSVFVIVSALVTALNIADMVCCGAMPPIFTVIRYSIGSLVLTVLCAVYLWQKT